MQCREPNKIGYHKFQCPIHPNKIRVVPHSCKTNICTSCATIQNDLWSEQIKNILPVAQYLHITFTIPQEFREFFGAKEDADWSRKSDFYDLAWQTIRGYCREHKNLLVGCLANMHTFGRDLKFNPHLHVIMPAGGLKQDEAGNYTWEKLDHLPRNYIGKAWKLNLLRYVLERTHMFDGYIDQVMYLYQSDVLVDFKKLIMLLNYITKKNDKSIIDNRTNTNDKNTNNNQIGINSKIKCNRFPTDSHQAEYDKWEKLFTIQYYVNIGKKRPYKQIISYTTRYNRRLPIAKSRILSFNEEEQTVTWWYHPHGQATPVDVTMSVFAFMDKLLQHVRPRSFKLIRYYGIFAQRNLKKFRPILKKVCKFSEPKDVPTWRERQLAYTGEDPLICPCCQKEMVLVEKAYCDASSGGLKVVPVGGIVSLKKDA